MNINIIFVQPGNINAVRHRVYIILRQAGSKVTGRRSLIFCAFSMPFPGSIHSDKQE
jgi:hypothetical protein